MIIIRAFHRLSEHIQFSPLKTVVFILLAIFLAACGNNGNDAQEDDTIPSFASLVGIDFYEVRRAFDNGLAYDTLGFVQTPEWHLNFISEDSIQIYDRDDQTVHTYPIYHDHDAYFHFARESWRVVDLHPDSIMLQRLSLKHLRVDKMRSNVYMRFYSADYIKKHLGTTVAELRKPRTADTSFVSERVGRANRNFHNVDSAFASQNFVKLESKSPIVDVTRRRLDSVQLMEQSVAYEYLYPEYDITINNAYRDFSHSFSVLVDEHGKMHVGKIFVMPEFVESRKKVITGIVDVYLQNLLDITPATTLGMPHSSVIYLRVKGKKRS